MRKLMFLIFFSLGVALLSVNTAGAQVDSTCQIFGDGGNANIPKNTTKRFYTKYVPGAVYNWTITGGNISISGPRNLHYVDVYGVECGPAQVCVTYSIDGQPPCCQCINVTVTGCPPPPPTCCINYVNSTMQYPWIKVKFQVCGPGVTSAKLFRWNGSAYVLIDTDSWPSGYNPANTYNLDINWNLTPYGCNEIFCLKICGYLADGTECCTSNFAIQTICDGGNNFIGVNDISYPGCNAPGGGGGGLPLDKVTVVKPKLSVSPNPASNTIQIGLPEKSKINTVTLVDRAGNIIKTYVVKGNTTFTIPVSGLKTGNYIIKPDDPTVESAVFIKQ